MNHPSLGAGCASGSCHTSGETLFSLFAWGQGFGAALAGLAVANDWAAEGVQGGETLTEVVEEMTRHG